MMEVAAVTAAIAEPSSLQCLRLEWCWGSQDQSHQSEGRTADWAQLEKEIITKARL